MAEKNLRKNLEYVEKNKPSLLPQYFNKYLIVFNEKIVNSFDTYQAAVEDAIKRFGPDADFLIYYMIAEKPVNFVATAIL